jgi:energy-coupling factor transporter ATP-binding protein EcfA2
MLTSETILPLLTVLQPPDAVPSVPPVTTRIQLLPFQQLSWENFERLCHRLTAFGGDVEHCARYGRQGEAQAGIDIYARLSDGKYHCLQAKRHSSFGASKLRDTVDLFLAGKWVTRASRFTVAVQASLGSTQEQEEIERQAKRLAEQGIVFSVLDGENLTDELREHPVLVDDFFGRPWVVALLGYEVAKGLGTRLDGGDFARVRSELARVYQAQFHFFDPGSFGSISDEDGRPALSLLERFLKPDILVREIVQPLESGKIARSEGEWPPSGAIGLPHMASERAIRSSDPVAGGRMRRLSVAEWLGESQRLVVLGDAGCGKSTLLRVIALDLLHDQEHFPELAARWGQHLPIYIPFARWASVAARDGHAIGIKEIVRRSLEQLLTESIADLLDQAINDQRVLVLIDGLDEWANEQAARATLSMLVTTVEAHSIPVMVSGRPRGLSRIGALPTNWKRGTVAPLSTGQQAAISGRWFERYSTAARALTNVSEAKLRTSRFMAELARDANLGALATVPLLLVGLVTLALRGQILPRTRNDIYDQLVRVLLEVHPDSRATASGDTESRFRHATDANQRRAAIARLGFAVREQTGGAGMPVVTAREVLRTYLASPHGFDFAEVDAAAAANEILSVNAETQGLIVEKGPGEVGFVHASFEEFLGAEHIGGWPFADIEEFVRAHAGEGRWRNVITNVLGRIQRRDEFDRLVAIVEMPDSDEVASYHRQFLLGDIAFGPGMRSTATAKRLALATMSRVESEDWMPARREALASVLRGLTDPTLKDDIDQRLDRWVPAQLSSFRRAALIQALGEWQPTRQLQDLLYMAMYDEERDVQRAASAAYAKAFASSAEACQRLLDGLARTRDLGASAALLESLAHGWAEVPEATSLFKEAWDSHSAEMCLVGVLGLAATGKVSDEARDAVLRGQSFWSDISYPYRELALAMLMKYWPGDETLVKSALRRLSHDSASPWEYDGAMAYLMESPVDRPDVCAWILAQFERDYPFNLPSDERIWSQVGRFAATHPAIRAAANAYWCNPENRIINLHYLPGYTAWIADPPLASVLIEVLNKKKKSFDHYWALSALLAGWGRNHPQVKSAIDALADASDEDLENLAAFLPEIMQDKAAARLRLLRMSTRPQLRRDLLATGLVSCGCDASDNEAVAAILAFPEELRRIFESSHQLFHTFGAHAKVRAFAVECIQEASGSLPTIAAAYSDDPELAPALFDRAVPLPVELRTQVVEIAAAGATGTALEGVLGRGMFEADPELRARMVIARYQALPSDAHVAARQALLTQLVAVGPDYESARAAALAGLVTIGEFGALAALEDRGKPVALVTASLTESIASVERLVCERFAEFEGAFGDSLVERFESHGRRSKLAQILSVAPSASPAARAAFLTFAELGKIPLSPTALRALAAERPGSDLLLTRCWDLLASRDHGNNRAIVNGEIGIILRDHFSGNVSVRQKLVERFRKAPITANAIPLAIFAPDDDELPFPVEFKTFGGEFGDWAVAMHVAAHRADSVTFCALLEAVVTRRSLTQFDAQQITNLAVEERLLQDPELEDLMIARIESEAEPSVSGSFARYLTTAGKLNSEARGRALDLLSAFSANQRLPVAGYDAVADQWRAVRATLLDAVSAGLELD